MRCRDWRQVTDKHALLTNHLAYERMMLGFAANWLSGEAGGTVNFNAAINLFWLHARTLRLFYAGEGGKVRKSDWHAKEFVPAWDTSDLHQLIRIDKDTEGATIWRRADKQIAHLTKDRTTDAEQKLTNLDASSVYGVIENTRHRFLDALPQNTRQVLDAYHATHRNHAISHLLKPGASPAPVSAADTHTSVSGGTKLGWHGIGSAGDRS